MYETRLSLSEYSTLPEHVQSMFPDRRISVGYFLTENSTKTEKGLDYGFISQVLYLAPSDLSGIDLCSGSSPQCVLACLNTSGQLGLDSGTRATMARTLFFRFRPLIFWSGILEEALRCSRKASKKGMKHSLRLNGTSDVPFEARKNGKPLQALMQALPETYFYDYTKIAGRCLTQYRERHGLSRYHLTFSFSGENWRACEIALSHGVNCAVCFDIKRGEPLPETYRGFKVIDGDIHDLRFLDEIGVIVGLRYKLPKKRDARNTQGKGTYSASEAGSFVVRL